MGCSKIQFSFVNFCGRNVLIKFFRVFSACFTTSHYCLFRPYLMGFGFREFLKQLNVRVYAVSESSGFVIMTGGRDIKIMNGFYKDNKELCLLKIMEHFIEITSVIAP